MNKDELIIIKPTSFKKTKRQCKVDGGIGDRAYKTLHEIRAIVEHYFDYPCDFGEIALHQIREKYEIFYKEEKERLAQEYDEMKRRKFNYCNYINDGD